MNEEQHLTYELGMTNVPSDATCDDNGLEESIGLTYADGEHRVIQKPVEKMTISGKTLVYVHTHGGTTRYIVRDVDSTVNPKVYWCVMPNDTTTITTFNELITYTGELHVESVGNTVILSTAEGLYYLLWDNDTYKTIGNSIPQISVSFKLDNFSDNDISYEEPYIWMEGVLDGKIVHREFVVSSGSAAYKEVSGSVVKTGMYETMKDALVGLVSMRLKKLREEKRFAFPFWARYAMRLYDGSYIYISQPFLLFPSVSRNWNIFTCNDSGELKNMTYECGGWGQTNYKPQYAKLYYMINLPQNFDPDDWKDIISGIDLFVSEEVMTFDMQGTWTIQNTYSIPKGDYDPETTTVNPLFDGNCILADKCRPIYDGSTEISAANINDEDTWQTYYQPSLLSEGEITQKLTKTANFYKLLEIDISKFTAKDGNWSDSTTEILRGTLVNLVNQPRLEHDDYFSRAPMNPKVMKTYNSRLHLADITRGFFGGFAEFVYAAYNGPETAGYIYEYWVDIKTDSGIRTVKASGAKVFPEMFDVWFYYPDPRAFRLKVKYSYNGVARTYEYPLKQHPNLNGAYYFGNLPSLIAVPTSQGVTIPSNYDPPTPEHLDNKVFVSENDNPYIFTSRGEYTVNLGAVTGFAIQSMALGEQEHGFHPMIVFSERGFSMFRVKKDDGTYLTTDVFSREVCSSPKSITETDGPVFFASKKGLMLILGSDSGCDVRCVSEQLSGKSDAPFAEFLQEAVIAYDYRDGLLWIFKDNSENAWIYNIKSGTFGRYALTATTPASPITVVNNYPDYLIQEAGKVYSLMERVDINDDNSTYAASMKTRAMKLGGGMTLKSIMRMKNIFDINGQDGSLSVQIWAKNNLNDAWVQLTHLRGVPHKYYQLRYTFTNLLAKDRFAGTVLITQERRTNKLR